MKHPFCIIMNKIPCLMIMMFFLQMFDYRMYKTNYIFFLCNFFLFIFLFAFTFLFFLFLSVYIYIFFYFGIQKSSFFFFFQVMYFFLGTFF